MPAAPRLSGCEDSVPETEINKVSSAEMTSAHVSRKHVDALRAPSIKTREEDPGMVRPGKRGHRSPVAGEYQRFIGTGHSLFQLDCASPLSRIWAS